MKHINSPDVTRTRIAKWIMEASPIKETWTERRLAIDFGGHTYLLTEGQTFQCPHCGHYDNKWGITEVKMFFKEHLGVDPYEIEVVCSVADKEKE